MRPGTDGVLSRDPRDSTAAKTRAELGTQYDPSPTSIDDEYDNGGWSKQSPQAQSGGYNGGQAGDKDDSKSGAVRAAWMTPSGNGG